MRKNLLSLVQLMLLLVCALSSIACEESKPIEDVWTAEELIAQLVADDYIVDVDGENVVVQGETVATGFGIMNIGVHKLHSITCDPFGWGPEYDWLCIMTGTKGRALGRDSAEPTIADIGTYVESGSEMYPGDITSTTYFNSNTYVNQLDTAENPAAFFGLTIAAFGPEWSPILEQWCTNDHIPMCIQD